MKITYYGHSCLLVENGEHRVIIDPFLTANPNSGGTTPDEIKVNAVILTHGHGDHFGDTLQIAQMNDCPVIATFELAQYCQSKGAKTHEMNLGGKHDFGGFSVKLTQAFHSSSVFDGKQFIYAGMPAGVLLSMGGKTLYHAGDTALFGDMKLIGERNRIDIAALPVGDNYTMGPEDAVTAAQWLNVKQVIPIHYNTFPVIEQDNKRLKSLFGDADIRCHTLQSRESLEI
ncbi:metal-dependent hydrolase [Ferviditalea candida]|uniref:UPF0173 metal-dependent hydrolase VF724_08210 n=1 Tax=Ferviditalea candida TaxID=3108399 RepID=A0ABU5ZGK4_9BACL|nr:metal-dependent hydrolase [Paenibacillaceae bacterium T2]